MQNFDAEIAETVVIDGGMYCAASYGSFLFPVSFAYK
jgi:hypothetical protein